jgi:hypothetical protein
MGRIPEFAEHGTLPPGDYEVSLDELRRSILVGGPKERGRHPNWDARWRSHLVDNLAILVRELWQVGFTEVFIDGSFAEDKDHPNDIDGYFDCDLMRLASGELERELNRIDPYKIWTWDPARRRPCRGYSKKQLPMWHQYQVELYPHFRGKLSGILDENGNELEFPSAFRKSRRDGKPRGIVKIRR